ncbi:MAG: putative toxin-antitoxin system toxin component, PIN family [Oscillospiraceae bacterium]|nr:putative toxin-antitoxin system toxin component, PIN family [Oscillospiraceae bacterium]
MIFAVFDTNVLIASLLSKHADSATVQVVNAIADNRIIPLYNYDILAEYDEVLHREKFRFSEERIRQTLAVIQEYGVSVGTLTPTGETLPDEDDLVFYELVMEKRDNDAYLITGNIKHFPQRRFIVTPAEMMEILRQMEQK